MPFPGATRRGGSSSSRTSSFHTASSQSLRIPAQQSEALPVTLGDAAGYTSIASGETGNNDALLASRWVLESRYGNCTVQSLSGFFANAAGNVRFGLYNESGSLPGTLLASTAETAVTNGRLVVPVTSPVSISPGAYWIVGTLSSGAVGVGTQTGYQVELSRYVGRSYQALPASWPGGGSGQDSHRCFAAHMTADTLTKPADPAPPSAPSPIAGQGYELVFRDEFEWLDRSKWTMQIEWDAPGRPNTQYVQDSVLHLVAYESDGWPNVTAETLGFLDQWQEGYFEARMRSTGNRADFPAFWLFSTDWVKRGSCAQGDRPGEIDIVELWGNQFSTVSSGACHSNTGDFCATNNQGSIWEDLNPTVIVGQWHTFGIKWQPTLLEWFTDNSKIGEIVIGPGTNWQTFARGMHIILYQWPDRGNSIDGEQWPMPTHGVDPTEIHTEFDWVRVWQVP